jgi:hypothetical protein
MDPSEEAAAGPPAPTCPFECRVSGLKITYLREMFYDLTSRQIALPTKLKEIVIDKLKSGWY